MLAIVILACSGEPTDDPSAQGAGSGSSAELGGTTQPAPLPEGDALVDGEPATTPSDSATALAQPQPLPPGCDPEVERLPGNSRAASFQFWCKREPAEVFQAWRDGDEAVTAYGPRWAIEVCGEESPWHSELLETFLDLPLTLGNVGFLSGGQAWRAVADCGDERVLEWIRTGLGSDLAPDVYGEFILMAFRVDLDDEVLAVPADRSRAASVRLRALEEYTRARVELQELPDFIVESFHEGRLLPWYVQRWVPMLLAHPETRDSMAVQGMRAVMSDAGEGSRSGLLAAIAIDVGAYGPRFSRETLAFVDESVAMLAESRTYEVRLAMPDVLSARGEHRNSSGQIVRHVPLVIEFERDGARCVPVWPSHIREIVDAQVENVRLLDTNSCPAEGTYVQGDFDGDGSPDVVVKMPMGDQAAALLVLNGDQPAVIRIDSFGADESLELVQPGPYYPVCFDGVPEEYWMPREGFAVSTGYDGRTLYYVNDRRLVVQFQSLASIC
jgi:hypothetical protein